MFCNSPNKAGTYSWGIHLPNGQRFGNDMQKIDQSYSIYTAQKITKMIGLKTPWNWVDNRENSVERERNN